MQILTQVFAIAVIFFTSLAAVLLPVLATSLPPIQLHVAKHFGSGVLLSTALLHLLEPATDALEKAIETEYPVAFAICVLSIMLVLAGDLAVKRKVAQLGDSGHHTWLAVSGEANEHLLESESDDPDCSEHAKHQVSRASALSSLLILEAGVAFHSVFIGLSVAVAGDEALPLALAVTVHQFFEGLGLGARLSTLEITECESKKPAFMRLPCMLGILYAFATPFGILVGMLASGVYNAESKGALLITGLTDAFSSGILLYTALVELFADEMLHAQDLATAPLKDIGTAWTAALAGAAAMAAVAAYI